MEVANNQGRIGWVDFAKGFCIFAVVSLYSTKFTHELFNDSGWMQYFADFARPFRMPDFFLLSGLFLARVINRPWPGYLDKKVIHYLYFFVLWTVISLFLNILVGDFVPVSIISVVSELWSMLSSWPFQMLWFIQMLAAYFLFTKLTNKVPKWLVFGVAVVLHLYPLPETGRTIIDEFFNRYVFFYLGYIAAPYFFKLAEKIQAHKHVALLALAVWGAVNWLFVSAGLADKYGLSLVLGVIGASAVISLGALTEGVKGFGWLQYLGRHSIVVYLGFYWVMRLYFYLFKDFESVFINKGNMCIFVTLLSVGSCVGVHALIRKIRGINWIFARPGWLVFAEYQR